MSFVQLNVGAGLPGHQLTHRTGGPEVEGGGRLLRVICFIGCKIHLKVIYIQTGGVADGFCITYVHSSL